MQVLRQNLFIQKVRFRIPIYPAEIPDLDLDFEHEYYLLDFFELLRCSADYKDESFRPALAGRVMETMTVFADSQLREKALKCLSEFKSGSEDGDYEGAIRFLKDLEALF